MFFFKTLSYLNLSILYVFSDILYLVAYYLVGYRKKVVRENLKQAFPLKTEIQRKAIEKRFFRNLTDSFAETIKLLTMNPRDLQKRFLIINPELISETIADGKIIIGMQAHFFNWEGHELAMSSRLGPLCEVVYLKITNPFFNHFMKTLRGRFGATLVERNSFTRHFMAKRNTPRLIALAADQRPQFAEIRYWTSFMGRETAFFEGGEKLAKKFNQPVIYGEISKPKRGHYTFEYRVLCAPPYDNDAEHSITELYIDAVEANIHREPALYLWSHNRWKESKVERKS
ncbi:MAG TPA: lysophospholipid acyltransferase family protein [Lunatimonas sp.]|nr:lysophospholipid acyltransferase family protein [Lunatimonas sp.]